MIRIATTADLERITGIYNQAIDAGFQTAFTERVTMEERGEWLKQHSDGAHPVFVYESDSGVVGWLSISPYRSGRAALRYCVEVSYFMDRDHQKQGIGSLLLAHALEWCARQQYRAMVAIILDRNEGSVKLMERFGFERWGHLPGVADFDGVVCGHLYYGKTLLPVTHTQP